MRRQQDAAGRACSGLSRCEPDRNCVRWCTLSRKSCSTTVAAGSPCAGPGGAPDPAPGADGGPAAVVGATSGVAGAPCPGHVLPSPAASATAPAAASGPRSAPGAASGATSGLAAGSALGPGPAAAAARCASSRCSCSSRKRCSDWQRRARERSLVVSTSMSEPCAPVARKLASNNSMQPGGAEARPRQQLHRFACLSCNEETICSQR